MRVNPNLVEELYERKQFDEPIYQRWQQRLSMTEAEFEAHLAELYPDQRETEPRHWRDERVNHPSQPVVSVSWYEARAYCAWLSGQTGQTWRLPTEVEAEAAARGNAGRIHAYGDTFDASKANTIGSRLKRLVPVGVFVEGDTAEGASDMGGNTGMWTSSRWGTHHDEPDFRYPYDATDGREEPEAALSVSRVVRGGGYMSHDLCTRAAYRLSYGPASRDISVGFRVVRADGVP